MVLIGEVLDRAWNEISALVGSGQFSSPQLFSLVVLLVVGFIGGKVFSELIDRILKMTRLDDLAVQSGVQKSLRRMNYHGSLSDFLAFIVRWAIYALTILATFYIVGAEFLVGYSGSAIRWGSRLIVVTLIILAGMMISARIERVVVQVLRAGRITGLVDESNAELPVYRIMGLTSKYFGYAVTAIIALGFLGVNTEVITMLVGLIGLGIVAALVLATRHLTRNIAISVYFQLSKLFRGGEHVTIGEYSGELVGVRPLYTKIKNGDQLYYIPNTRLVTDVIEYTEKGE